MDREALIGELTRDEGQKLFVYDDATGLPLKPGMVCEGWPTIGIGRNLAGRGITAIEARLLVNDDIDAVLTELESAFPWFSRLDDVRQRVLVNMGFAGVATLKGFHDMLGCIADGDYAGAADALLDSAYARQVGARAVRLAQMMRSGQAV